MTTYTRLPICLRGGLGTRLGILFHGAQAAATLGTLAAGVLRHGAQLEALVAVILEALAAALLEALPAVVQEALAFSSLGLWRLLSQKLWKLTLAAGVLFHRAQVIAVLDARLAQAAAALGACIS